MRDAKALYRRAQAREQQDKVGDAFKDAKIAYQIEPNNAAIGQMLQRLIKANQKKVLTKPVKFSVDIFCHNNFFLIKKKKYVTVCCLDDFLIFLR